MQLSKYEYYSDYVAYPIVIGSLAAAALRRPNWQVAAHWTVAVLAGVGAWTLMEYVLHRIALHRIAFLVPMHGLHHSSPLAYIGTPTWLSVSLLMCGIFAPTWFLSGFTVASGLTAGVMLGYLWYGLVHHLIHHRSGESPMPFLKELRAWHMRHHYSPKSGNFGVTTAFWDRVFGTAIEPPRGAGGNGRS